jgi:hypothetical protein
VMWIPALFGRQVPVSTIEKIHKYQGPNLIDQIVAHNGDILYVSLKGQPQWITVELDLNLVAKITAPFQFKMLLVKYTCALRLFCQTMLDGSFRFLDGNMKHIVSTMASVH